MRRRKAIDMTTTADGARSALSAGLAGDAGKEVKMKRVFIHRYKWSHDKRRKQFRKLKKTCVIRILETLPDGWLCEFPADFPVAPTR